MRPLFFLAVSALTLAPATVFAQDLAPGPGADVVGQACSACHGIDQVTSVRKDEGGWRDTVTAMVNNGASLTDAQMDVVVHYLATNYGMGPTPAAAPAAAATAPADAAAAPAAPAAPAPAPAQ